jgi:hypothetical protein
MAINVKTSAKDPEMVLFNLLLQEINEKQLLTTVINDMHPKWVVGFYSITAKFNDLNGQPQTMATNLPCSTTSLFSKAASESERLLCRNKVLDLLTNMQAKYGQELTGKFTKAADNLGDLLEKSAEQMPPAFVHKDGNSAPPKAKMKFIDPAAMMGEVKVAKPVHATAVPTICKLRDATVLGQPVYGTSAGSVYWLVAKSPTLKLAARLQHGGGSISVRAEGDLTEKEKQLLVQAGFSANKDYLSMHMSCDGIPHGKVVGALLMGIGLEFEEQIATVKGLKLEG